MQMNAWNIFINAYNQKSASDFKFKPENSTQFDLNKVTNQFLSNLISLDSLQSQQLKDILSKGLMPACMQHSIICPAYKGKGKDKQEADSYRLISLISKFYVIIERIVLKLISDDV